ncbi:MAG: hypothetical protein M1269_04350 [Chloroflexi bacterium]|nr:hypothetical protein [Chloroflexota bacterium]
MDKHVRNNLIFALFLISLGGLMLHLRIHPPLVKGEIEWYRTIPFFAGIITIFLITFLFLKKETAPWAYLLNGLTVILGVLLMSHFSLGKWDSSVSFPFAILSTTLGDSIILLGKFMVGKTLFESYYPERVKNNWKWPITIRFLYNGWWAIHAVLITVVYSIGFIFLKKLL